MAVATRTDGVAIRQRERPLRPDLMLVLPLFALMALGIVMVLTASRPRLELLGAEDINLLARRHAIFVVVGIVAFLVTSLITPRAVKLFTGAVYVVSLLTLVAVLFAPEVNFTHRWIQVGIFRFQPSEFAKIAVILALAAMLAQPRDGVIRWVHLLRSALLVGIPAVLIFRQPDLGTMLVFGFIAIVMLFAGGATWRQLAFGVVTVAIASVVLFQAKVLKAYQLTRITSFLDPSDDLATTALYNQTQSEIAIGSGGFLGKGLFGGTQTNLSFVPEQSTDFIFTAVGEQLGFIGGAIVIVLYAIIVWRCLMAAATARDRFGQLVAIGVASLIVFHVFVNIGMTMRLMPVTGLPLPFLSSGGSAIIAMSIALGLIHGLWMRRALAPGERVKDT